MEIAALTVLGAALAIGIVLLCIVHYEETKSPRKRRNRK